MATQWIFFFTFFNSFQHTQKKLKRFAQGAKSSLFRHPRNWPPNYNKHATCQTKSACRSFLFYTVYYLSVHTLFWCKTHWRVSLCNKTKHTHRNVIFRERMSLHKLITFPIVFHTHTHLYKWEENETKKRENFILQSIVQYVLFVHTTFKWNKTKYLTKNCYNVFSINRKIKVFFIQSNS